MNADVEFFRKNDSIQAERPTTLPWLTVEIVTYAGLSALALAARLALLGARPLSEAEASQALASWSAVQGSAAPVAGAGSPLLFSLNILTFLLFGANDFTARLAPALLGSALVWLPYPLRHRLGRFGSLAASAIFAFSPSLLYFSRLGSGDIEVALGAMMTTVGLFCWMDRQEARWLYLAAAGMAIALTASSNGYLFLLLTGTFIGAIALFGPRPYRDAVRGAANAAWSTPGLPGNVAIAFGAVFLAGATTFFFHFTGLSMAAELPARWLASFVSSTGEISPPPLILLALYEPLILAFGLASLGAVIGRRDILSLFLTYWFAIGAVFITLERGREPGSILLVVLPLALLAAGFLGRILEESQRARSWQSETLLVGIALCIFAYGYINLSGYARSGDTRDLVLALTAGALTGGIVTLFWVWYGPAQALHGGALALALLLGISSFSAGCRLSYDDRTLAYEPMAVAPSSQGVHDLLRQLERLSSHEVGDAHLIDITVETATGPALRWALRDFRNVNFVEFEDIGTSPTTRVLITMADHEPGTSPPYAGQAITMRTSWRPQGLDAPDMIGWILFRQTATPAQEQKVILWNRQTESKQE
jgi:uncharacterized protein (TIGR03663 family)